MPGCAALPMRMGVDCQLGKEPAENLQVLSRNLRTLLAKVIPQGVGDPRPNPEVLRKLLLIESPEGMEAIVQGPRQKRLRNLPPAECLQADAVPVLVHLLHA